MVKINYIVRRNRENKGKGGERRCEGRRNMEKKKNKKKDLKLKRERKL